MSKNKVIMILKENIEGTDSLPHKEFCKRILKLLEVKSEAKEVPGGYIDSEGTLGDGPSLSRGKPQSGAGWWNPAHSVLFLVIRPVRRLNKWTI